VERVVADRLRQEPGAAAAAAPAAPPTARGTSQCCSCHQRPGAAGAERPAAGLDARAGGKRGVRLWPRSIVAAATSPAWPVSGSSPSRSWRRAPAPGAPPPRDAKLQLPAFPRAGRRLPRRPIRYRKSSASRSNPPPAVIQRHSTAAASHPRREPNPPPYQVGTNRHRRCTGLNIGTSRRSFGHGKVVRRASLGACGGVVRGPAARRECLFFFRPPAEFGACVNDRAGEASSKKSQTCACLGRRGSLALSDLLASHLRSECTVARGHGTGDPANSGLRQRPSYGPSNRCCAARPTSPAFPASDQSCRTCRSRDASHRFAFLRRRFVHEGLAFSALAA